MSFSSLKAGGERFLVSLNLVNVFNSKTSSLSTLGQTFRIQFKLPPQSIKFKCLTFFSLSLGFSSSFLRCGNVSVSKVDAC